MHVLVTGGRGFIGRRIIELMSDQDHEFLVLDLEDEKDVTNKKGLHEWTEGFEPDVIFHLAGILGTPETFSLPQKRVVAVNVLGTVNMLEIAKIHHARLIYPALLRIWHNPYCITKACGEDYVMMFHKHYGLDTVTLTLANVYGPGQRTAPYKKIIPTFAVAALRDEPIPVSGSGKQTVDMVYIDDVARAFILAAESTEAVGQQMQIGTGREITVNEVAEMIIELTGSKSKIEHTPWRLGEDPETYVTIDTSKAEKLLGFRAEIPLEDGLLKAVKYYERRLHSIT